MRPSSARTGSRTRTDTAGEALDRRPLPGAGPGALPHGDAVPDGHVVLRSSLSVVDLRSVRRSGRGGGSRSAACRRSCSCPTCSCTCSPTCRRSTPRRRRRSPAGGRSSRCSTSPVEIVEPAHGVDAARGPARGPNAGTVSYRVPAKAGPVLHGISHRGAGAARTSPSSARPGSGKTTFAKLLTRLADPARGRHRGRRRRPARVARASRHAAIRMVPQDGFLFDMTVRENVRDGRAGRERPRGRDRVRGAGPGRLGRLAPRRAGHAGRRARRGALGRRAPARLARAGADRRARPADPRRGDERGRPGDRAPHHRGAATAVRRPDRDHDRAPPLDRRARRSRSRVRRRPARRGGNARRAPRARRGLRGAARELARQHARGARGLRGPIGFRAA